VIGAVVDGSVEVVPNPRGDCNGDTQVDAGDISACVLEIFDGDGSFWKDAPGGTFRGTPYGCDSNGDTTIDAGDIVCTVLTIFNGPGACTTSTAVAAADMPRLTLPDSVPAQTGQVVEIPVSLVSSGDHVAAAVFSLVLDESQLRFDPTDSNQDGIPDAVVPHVTNDFDVTVRHASGQTRLDFLLSDSSLPLASLRDGRLVTIRLKAEDTTAGQGPAVEFAQEPAASLGSTSGASIPVVTQGQTVLIAERDRHQQFFLPSVSQD
jgi:hypothetical protein